MPELNINGICKLTRDIEVRKAGAWTVYTLGLCAFRKYAKEGKQAEDFYDAEVLLKEPNPLWEKQLTKGKLIFIERGYLRNDRFQIEGQERNKIKFNIQSLEILSSEAIASSPSIEHKVPKVDTKEATPVHVPAPIYKEPPKEIVVPKADPNTGEVDFEFPDNPPWEG